MKSDSTRIAMRFGTIVFVTGFIAYGIAFILIWFADAATVAMAFATVGFFLSLPSVLIAGDPFSNPYWLYLLPITLVLNSLFLTIVVWTFLKLKIIVDKKVYKTEES